ncbi:MAG: tetratricopeptide repeat protein [Anaerolineaceae bacterium]|nr:tetratricopeptide repeat protein [Anaerolineaceae bacterium]
MIPAIIIGLGLAALMLYQIPRVQRALDWRIEYAMIYINRVFDPLPAVPVPQENSATQYPTATPKPTRTQPIPTQTPISSPTATIQPTQIPGKVILSSPAYEKEDLNNCGPATLSMYLKHFGWVGDQFTISDRIKPIRADRNVNIEELASYVMTDIGYLQVEYRVGGNLDVLKKIIASGIPVMIEGSFKLQKSFWPNDDRWAGHYVLLTGYDDAEKIFITQDSELGPDQRVPYDQLFEEWESFNRVYMMLFPPEQAPVYQTLLGDDWDRDLNRKRAIDIFQAETKADPKNAFAFFNLGTNLVYFDRYGEAFNAYDTALKLKLPQRMLRYQFGVYMTYFNTGRIDELIALCDYALEITPNSEEAMLWKGWGLYRQGRSDEALKIFQKALEARPDYSDANYAINFVLNN